MDSVEKRIIKLISEKGVKNFVMVATSTRQYSMYIDIALFGFSSFLLSHITFLSCLLLMLLFLFPADALWTLTKVTKQIINKLKK